MVLVVPSRYIFLYSMGSLKLRLLPAFQCCMKKKKMRVPCKTYHISDIVDRIELTSLLHRSYDKFRKKEQPVEKQVGQDQT